MVDFMYACMPGARTGSAAADISDRRRIESFVKSGRGNETGAGESAVIDVDDPRGPFVKAAGPRFDHALIHELFDQLPHDVAVRAEHRVIELGVAHYLHRPGQPVAFGELRRLLDRQLASASQRLDSLHAAQEGARVDG